MRRAFGLLLAVPTLAAPAVPSVSAFQMPNGMRFQLLEDHQRPLVRLEVRIPIDPAEIPAGWEGIDQVLAQMLTTSGVDGSSRETFLRAMDEQAIELEFRLERSTLVWSCIATSHAQDAAFRFLAQAVARPRFEAASFSSRKLALRERLISSRQQVLDLFQASLGTDEARSVLTPSRLARMEWADLERFRRRVIRPGHATLRAYGDLSLDQLRQAAALEWGAWGPGSEPALARHGGELLPLERLFLWINDQTLPEVTVGLPAPHGANRAAECLAIQALQEAAEPARVSFRGSPGAAWRIHGPSIIALQAFLKSLEGKIWTPEDLRRLIAAQEAQRIVQSLHPSERIAADEFPDFSNLKTEDLQQALRARLEVSNLRWLVLGISESEAARLQKEWPGPVKVMPLRQSAGPDPGSGPTLQK